MTITTDAASPVTVAGQLGNGQTLVLPPNCVGTPSETTATTPVTCNLGTVANGTSGPPILVEFQSPSQCSGNPPLQPCQVNFTASATYSRGSISMQEKISSSGRFLLFPPSSSTLAQAVVGDCPDLSKPQSRLSTLSSSLPQTGTITFGKASSSTGDPCTPAALGALNFPNGKPSIFALGQVWFVELPQLDSQAGTGLATATLQVTNLPSGTNKNNFTLREFANDLFSGSFDANRSSLVPACIQPTPTSPSQPPAGSDACISNISSLSGGGPSINLILNPALGDSSFSG